MKTHITTDENEDQLLKSARSEMEKFGLDIKKYSLRALRLRGNEYGVICQDVNASKDERRRSNVSVPSFEVLLDGNGKVSKAYFVR